MPLQGLTVPAPIQLFLKWSKVENRGVAPYRESSITWIVSLVEDRSTEIYFEIPKQLHKL